MGNSLDGENEGNDVEAEVWSLVDRVNTAWVESNPDDIQPFLHPDVVTVLPGFSGVVEGREAAMQAYRDFCERAEVHGFGTSDSHVQVVEDTAVATYAFRIDYEMAGERLEEHGHEVQVLVRTDEGWKVAWRMLASREADG